MIKRLIVVCVLLLVAPDSKAQDSVRGFDGALLDFAVHSANGGGFAEFARDTQLRLLSALDGEMSQRAEDALLGDDAVRRANIHLQTPLGGRRGQVGLDILGAFAESADGNAALGWQLRGYGAEGGVKGGNIGFFLRQLSDDGLFGANVFADYENNQPGEFARAGLGIEVKDRSYSFAANAYFPVSGGKRMGDRVFFSRKGFDVNARWQITGDINMRLDYYRFYGKNQTADDSGFRYGFEFLPAPNLRLGMFYDNGGDAFGGELLYVHTIGTTPQQQASDNTDFRPDLFAPVWREHSQRIASYTSKQRGVRAAHRVITTTTPQMTIITIVPTTTITTTSTTVTGNDPDNPTLMTTTTPITVTMDITMTSVTPPETITITAGPPVDAVFSGYHSRAFVAGFFGTVGTIMASGGSGSGYTYSAPPQSDYAVMNNGEVRFSINFGATTFIITLDDGDVRHITNDRTTAIATIIVDDDDPGSAAASIVLTVSSIMNCSFLFSCPDLGHRDTDKVKNPPPLALMTLIYRAGVNIQYDEQQPSRFQQRFGILAYYAALHGMEVQPALEFLLQRGANINEKYTGPPYREVNALDFANRNNSANVQWLMERGARCEVFCRTGQTHINGDMCTRDTGTGGVSNGADCAP